MLKEKAIHKILRKLKRKGFECRVVHLSDHGSSYIHITNSCNGIRISDHREKEGLRYIYNIRSDMFVRQKHDGRYFFPIEQTNRAVNFIIKQEKKRRKATANENNNRRNSKIS